MSQEENERRLDWRPASFASFRPLASFASHTNRGVLNHFPRPTAKPDPTDESDNNEQNTHIPFEADGPWIATKHLIEVALQPIRTHEDRDDFAGVLAKGKVGEEHQEN